VVTLTVGLVIPDRDAVIVTVPTFIPVNCPPDNCVNAAIAGSELVQVTRVLISKAMPSE